MEEERGNLAYLEGDGKYAGKTQSAFAPMEQEGRERVASNEMCTFLILN
ncbi:nucleoside recognition protein, partial [Parablautia intestinalis]